MRSIHMLVALAVSAASSMAWAWTPPPKPDPELILAEAQADARANRLADAAAKHRWYHHNVLGLLPSHSGVRVSFALGYWFELARRYPPAMRDILSARHQALAQVEIGGTQATQAFIDLTNFNRLLGASAMTRNAFALLAEKDPRSAKATLGIALPALVEVKAFALASAHLDADALLERMSRRHADLFNTSRLPENQREQYLRFQRQFADREWALVVVTLAQTERQPEANMFASRAKWLLGEGALTPLIDAALEGTAPAPLPLNR